MPTKLCPVAITCEGVDDPITNYSSEALDQILFGAMGFPIYFPDNPLGEDGSDPALPPMWFAQSCLGFCFSSQSQAAADACAQIGAYLCEQAQRTPPNGRVNSAVYYNTLQSCSFPCPDGSLFVAFVPAGRVASGSQVLADRIAYQMACAFAATHYLCLPDITSACQDQAYSAQITMRTTGAPYTFTITSGALPAGLTLETVGSRVAVISGTPTVAGNYSFRVTVTDNTHNSVSKDYTLTVLGITNSDTLPAATVGTAYSEALTAVGGTAPYTFTLELGTLPDGLTLASDGTISGTPTTGGDASFVVGVADSGTAFCTKTFSLHVTSVTCPVLLSTNTIIDNSSGIAVFANTGDVIHPNKVYTAWIGAQQRFHIFDADTGIDYATLAFLDAWDIFSAAYDTTNQKIYASLLNLNTSVWELRIIDALNDAFGAALSSGPTGDANGYYNVQYSVDLDRVIMLNSTGGAVNTDLLQLNPNTNAFSSFTAGSAPGVGQEFCNQMVYVPSLGRFYCATNRNLENRSYLRAFTPAGVAVPAVTLDFYPNLLYGIGYSPDSGKLYLIAVHAVTGAVTCFVYNPNTSTVETSFSLGASGTPSDQTPVYWAAKHFLMVALGNNTPLQVINTQNDSLLCSITAEGNQSQFRTAGANATKYFATSFNRQTFLTYD